VSFWTALLYDRVTHRVETKTLTRWRRELLAHACGEVLEIGAGTGANVRWYGADRVRRLAMTEPDRHMRKRLRRRAGSSAVSVEIHRAPAEALPFPDSSFDCVVSTLVLCSVEDLARALSEIRRVLRPGAPLLFVEHVADDDARVFAWQRRLEPLWRLCADGCRLTRDTEAAIARAGFRFESLAHDEMRPAPRIVRPVIRGVAR
jgi:ubiquinone/menaquinone biosynthesis C-methylase UbiE